MTSFELRGLAITKVCKKQIKTKNGYFPKYSFNVMFPAKRVKEHSNWDLMSSSYVLSLM